MNWLPPDLPTFSLQQDLSHTSYYTHLHHIRLSFSHLTRRTRYSVYHCEAERRSELLPASKQGLSPTPSWSQIQCLCHVATSPLVSSVKHQQKKNVNKLCIWQGIFTWYNNANQIYAKFTSGQNTVHHIAGQSLIYCDDTCHFTFEKDIWGKNEAESNGKAETTILLLQLLLLLF